MSISYPDADWKVAVDHIERVLKLGGPGAAGLGTDYDGITDPPAGMEDVSTLPKLTEELLRRGHSEDDRPRRARRELPALLGQGRGREEGRAAAHRAAAVLETEVDGATPSREGAMDSSRETGRLAGWVILGGCLLAGLPLAGYFAGRGTERFRSGNRTVTVKGLVEKEVKADRAIWTLNLRRAGAT